MKRQCGDGGAENGKEGGVDEGEEEDVMNQIDEIGRIANERWEASISWGEDSWGYTEYRYSTSETEAEHQGRKDWCIVGQQHGDGKQYTKHIGRNLHPFKRDNQIHLTNT